MVCILLLLMNREPEGKDASLLRERFPPRSFRVLVDDPMGNGEAEANPSLFGGKERIEELLHILRRDTDPGIPDRRAGSIDHLPTPGRPVPVDLPRAWPEWHSIRRLSMTCFICSRSRTIGRRGWNSFWTEIPCFSSLGFEKLKGLFKNRTGSPPFLRGEAQVSQIGETVRRSH